MTLRLMSAFGNAATPLPDGAFRIVRRSAYRPFTGVGYAIEPDATAASYFLALPLAVPAVVRVDGLNDSGLQGDIAFAEVLKKTGLQFTEIGDGDGLQTSLASASPVGGEHDFNAISDTFLTLAALAPLLVSPLTIRGVAHARKQETDRVLAAATELEKLGQRVSPTSLELRADTAIGDFTIYPDREEMRRRSADAPVSIRTYEDHRMAMSFAILGSHDLHGDGRPWLVIEDPACCGKTFPSFFAELKRLRTYSAGLYSIFAKH
jgi:3-phosphoshikimate 1-carboxyvinyltransferase